MSNNLVLQQLSISNNEMDQMELNSMQLDSSVSNMLTGVNGPMFNIDASPQLLVSENQMRFVEPISNYPGSKSFPVLNRQIALMEHRQNDLGPQQFLIPNRFGEMEVMLNNQDTQKLLVPSKRKEPISSNVPQQLPIANKRIAQMYPLSGAPGLPQLSGPHKKTMQVQTMSRYPGLQNSPAANKRMARNELSSKSGLQNPPTPKNRSAQMDQSSRVQAESFESVRSKMRESLAAALALVSHNQDKAPKEGRNSRGEAASTAQQTQEDCEHAQLRSTPPSDGDHVAENPSNTLPFKESCSADDPTNKQSTLRETISKESMSDSVQTWRSEGQNFMYNTILSNEDAPFGDNFFVKDELLQGNGLSWVLDLDMEVAKTNEAETEQRPESLREDVDGNGREQAVLSPQNLAFKIEEELFKLYGGVNKKYKEKGRSLLFNLKDRNNPELRERVMSGEISPGRLCSMTAEELASKELSQWRMAKAEELAQMVVLPETSVDIRRLVKKTHKGEFQVEVEEDDSVSVEVSVGTNALTQHQSDNKETKTQTSSKSDGVKNKEVEDEENSSENHDNSCSLTISSDGTDLMQGLVVEELKDAEQLPPIVSLHEFMESLDSEPPFENLPLDGGNKIPHLKKDQSKIGYESLTTDVPYKDPVDATPSKPDTKDGDDNMDAKHSGLDVKVKSNESPIELKSHAAAGVSNGEHTWEGVLQLNVSTMVAIVGYFRSGEKTSTKEWPSILEIKGRVRLDAFEKFIQELPLSRSRAIMVAHFVVKEGSSEHERTSLSEVVDSYVVDERLGYAEPAPAVEIYFCPPHTKILEILTRHLPKEHTEVLKSTDNGLIGVVVWRRPHLTSTVSQNSSSHHKHSSKKHHVTSRRQRERETKGNLDVATLKPALSNGAPVVTNPQPLPDVDDDVPPGFGPVAGQDEYDLPEFNFSGSSKLSTPNPSSQVLGMPPSRAQLHAPSRPVDHVRQLIHKYGQTEGTGVWNDDDDDIPEWQPQAQLQRPPPMSMRHGYQQPELPHVVSQSVGPAMPLQHLHSPWQGQALSPHGLQQSQMASGRQYGVPVLQAGQLGIDWRLGASRSGRGF